MKKVTSILLLICMLVTMVAFPIGANAAESETHIVMSYNVNGALKTSNHEDICDVVEAYNPDLIAFNEVSDTTGPSLVAALESAGYTYFGTSDWAPNSPEAIYAKACWRNYVFYKTSKFDMVDSGTFSISDNPSDPHAFISIMQPNERVGEGSEGRPRNCNWVYLASKETNDRFIFSSAHVQWLDGIKDYNQLGLNYLAEQLTVLRNKYNCDIICGGDMNAKAGSANIKQVTDMGFLKANEGKATYSPNSTSIDNVFYTNGFAASNFKVGKEYTSSDHYPICVTLEKSSIPTRYKVEGVANDGGEIEFDVEGASAIYALPNETVKVKLIPASGHKVSAIKVNGTAIDVKNDGDESEYEFKMPSKDCKLEVTFEAIKFNVTTNIIGGKGTVGVGAADKTETTATVGEEIKIYVTPAEGFKVTIVKANAKKLKIENDGQAYVYSYNMIAKDSKISVTFERDPNYVATAKPTDMPMNSATATTGSNSQKPGNTVAPQETDSSTVDTDTSTNTVTNTAAPDATDSMNSDFSGSDYSSEDSDKKDDGNNTLIIVLCCIAGGIIVAAGIFALVFFVVLKKKFK